MSEPAKKCVMPIKVRWATEEDYRKTTYQVGTLYRVTHLKPVKVASDTAAMPKRTAVPSGC